MKSKLFTKRSLIPVILTLAILIGLSFVANATIVNSRLQNDAYRKEYAGVTTDDGQFVINFEKGIISKKYGVVGRFQGGNYGLTTANVPSVCNDVTITTINTDAFSEFRLLEEIVLPQTITDIKSKSISNCSGLKKIFIPASVTKIDDDAFSETKNFTMYVEKGSYAESFAKKNNIKTEYYTPSPLKGEVKIENAKTIFGAQYDSFVYDILYDNSGTPFCAITHFNSMDYESTNLVVPKQINGADVTVLMKASLAFGYDIETITLPETVTSIGSQAFAESETLKKVYFTENVTGIGEEIFLNSPNAVICAPKDSYAHKYAIENNIKFQEFSK